jgi:hypothetical protein
MNDAYDITTVVREHRLKMFRQVPIMSAQYDWHIGDDKKISIMII